ncbi:MAG: transglycosylase SLT domain-containing protein [Chromatiales bacterium]
MHLRVLARLLVAFTISLAVCAHADTSLESQREQFLQAEQALQNGKITTFNKLKSKLGNYVLYPYLEFEQLRKDLHRRKPQQIQTFLEQYHDTPLARRLRISWLLRLARQGRWQQYLDFYQDGLGTTLKCHQLNALLHTGQAEFAWNDITATWLHGRSRPKACDAVFKQWQDAGHQTTELVWQRINLALQANQIRLARYLGKSLPESDQQQFQLWLKIRRYPHKTRLAAVPPNHPYRAEVLAQGIQKLSSKDLPEAISRWEQLKLEVSFTPQQLSATERALSLRFLDKPSQENFDYLVFTEPCHEDSKLQEIRIRAALLHQKWDDLLLWLNALPEQYQAEDRWLYWKARALQATGQSEQAAQLLESLSTQRSYYGFLAADWLEKDYQLNHTELEVDANVLAKVQELGGMQRSRELLALDRNIDARREWFYMSANFDRDQLMAAAKLAHDWGWHDRAILTIAQAEYWDDLTIRFPLEHQEHIFSEAEDQNVDPAWIYAMVRQESAFMQDAQSSVGALGLMQLMPRTAKSVARKLRQRRPGKHDLFKPEKNIELGTAYLRQIYDRLDRNPVLAIAAYNAGPHRVKRWLPEQEMPADIWIELVPFKETRNYLKSVLAYTVIYEHKLGHRNRRMSDRMPPVVAEAKPDERRVAATDR